MVGIIVVFHCSLSDSKSLQIFRILLSNLADFYLCSRLDGLDSFSNFQFS